MQNQFTLTVTFGKYAGFPLATLIRDTNYCEWLDRQTWWPNTWEAKAIAALARGETVPEPPRRRTILEHEYEDGERPTKVRRVCSRNSIEEQFMDIYCPSCFSHSRFVQLYKEDNSAKNVFLARCVACAQHIEMTLHIGINPSLQISTYPCPTWAKKTQQEYEQATIRCAEKRGPNDSHSLCGCLTNFQCACVIVE